MLVTYFSSLCRSQSVVEHDVVSVAGKAEQWAIDYDKDLFSLFIEDLSNGKGDRVYVEFGDSFALDSAPKFMII